MMMIMIMTIMVMMMVIMAKIMKIILKRLELGNVVVDASDASEKVWQVIT